MSTIDLIEIVKQRLTADERVKLAVLFGSLARGRAKPTSDIDIGVAYAGQLTLDEKIDLGQKLSAATGREVDVVDLRRVEGVLLQQILNCRVTLVRREPELMGNLIAKRVTEEADFMPVLDRMLKKRRERFINGKTGH